MGRMICLATMLALLGNGAASADRLRVAGPAYAANACVELCQQKNRVAVDLCNYPKKEIKELTECLNTARRNFDACMQACR